ncbi:MAG: TlpA family protein disulfide reductase [Bacteroidaceae bacterium]|nr:TlpA family protein disulfide reductase [Bacteroidaceae bacterium]
MKKTLLILMFALTALAVGAQNKKQIIWNNVQNGYSNAGDYVKITNVAMYDDRTEVSFSLYFNGERHEISLSKDMSLYADNNEKKAYKAKSATVIGFDKPYKMTSDTLNFMVTFEPVPIDTKMLMVVEKKWGLVVTNIHNADFIPEGITNTYWRNNATGDWLIGIAKHHLIFDSKVWDIESRTEEKGGYTIKTTDGKTVKIGKLKKGVRTFAIDGRKPVVCSPIVTKSLPDYPQKDNREDFVDNDFADGDSVTIVGWLKDMPQQWNAGREFKIRFDNIFTSEQETFYTKVDSLGRFTLKFPLVYTTTVDMDWHTTVVEPGKTYFFLKDFMNNQILFMGDDVRLQNEDAGYKIFHFLPKNLHYGSFESSENGAMAYKHQIDSLIASDLANFQKYAEQHPNISQRYINYYTREMKAEQGYLLMLFIFRMSTLPQEYVDFVTNELWNRKYIIGSIYDTFIHSFLIYQTDKCNNKSAMLKSLKEEGVTFTDKENRIIDEYPEIFKNIVDKIYTAKTDAEKDKWMNFYKSSKEIAVVDSLLKKYDEQISIMCHKNAFALIDSVCGNDKIFRDVCITQHIYSNAFTSKQTSLNPWLQEYVDKEIQLPSAKKFLMEQHKKYLAFEQKGANLPVFKSADNVAGMTDGEKILRKIIEPYKGKIVLLDVWGTWCVPCKMALKDSQKEFEALKDYNIQYLYLAKRSPEQAWKNVINEYKVTGDNVAHYNLPADQQSAVENFLKVHSFPSYRLIDADGNIIDMRVDARDLEGLKKLLNKMEKK